MEKYISEVKHYWGEHKKVVIGVAVILVIAFIL